MKKLFYVALAALVLVSCGGDNKETKTDTTKKETTKKDSQTVQQDNNAKGGKTDKSGEESGNSLKGSFEGNFEGSEEDVDFDMDMSDGNIGMSTETEYGEVGYSVGKEGVNYNANVGGMDMGAGMDTEGNVDVNMGGHSFDAGNAFEDADDFSW